MKKRFKNRLQNSILTIIKDFVVSRRFVFLQSLALKVDSEESEERRVVLLYFYTVIFTLCLNL